MTEEQVLKYSLSEFQREYLTQVQLKPNVAAVLRKMKESCISLHVLTASSHSYVDGCLENAGVLSLFTKVWSTDDFGLSKAARQILPAVEHIESHPELNTSVSELANLCFLSESYFRVQFRGHFGCSPTDYRNRLRVEKAQELLDSSLWTTELIAEKLGFCDTSHFYRVYKKIMGTTPRKGKE